MEKKILGFQLGALHSMDNINIILKGCYTETGEKFSIHFNGSAGYLDNIEFTCERESQLDNIIQYAMLVQTPNYNEISVTIYHSKDKGVRVEVENLKEIEDNFFKNLK